MRSSGEATTCAAGINSRGREISTIGHQQRLRKKLVTAAVTKKMSAASAPEVSVATSEQAERPVNSGR